MNNLTDYLEISEEEIYFKENLKKLSIDFHNFSSNKTINNLMINLSDEQKNNSYRIYSLIAKTFGIDISQNPILNTENKDLYQIDQEIKKDIEKIIENNKKIKQDLFINHLMEGKYLEKILYAFKKFKNNENSSLDDLNKFI
jgi:hypothetical protein